MATGHGLAVLTNSCIKPPVNPDTGLSSTLNERSHSGNQTLGYENHTFDGDRHLSHLENDDLDFGGKTSPNLFDRSGNAMAADLANLSSSDFYQKLMELKQEHQHTLKMCEDLYSTKIQSTSLDEGGVELDSVFHKRSSSSKDHGHGMKSQKTHQAVETKRRTESPSDRIKDLSRNRPPKGPRPASAPRRSGRPGASTKSKVKVVVERNVEDFWRANNAELSDDFSSDDEAQVQHELYKVLKKSSDEEEIAKGNDTRYNAVTRIDDMWDNFSIVEYAPRTRPRPRSASASRMDATSKQEKDEANRSWRHRITVPKPFSMTMREESFGKTKSRTLEEFEREKNMKEIEEAAECQKSIKPTPVPAHVYMPLYDEMMDKQEQRRNYHRQASEQLLKSQEKPFNFMKREEEMRKIKGTEMEKYLREEIDETKKKPFKARPFPHRIFDKDIDDKILEEEEYRRIRVQMRSEDLLRSSSLPRNMKERGDYLSKSRSRQKDYAKRAQKAGLPAEPNYKPRVNQTVPDFDTLHRKMQHELWQEKEAKEATVCKPFNLRTSRISERRKKLAKEQEDLERARRGWQSKSYGTLARTGSSLSSTMDTIPTKKKKVPTATLR